MNNLTAYLGPYVECKCGTKNTTIKRNCCPTCKRSAVLSIAKFCSQCGVKIEEVELLQTVSAISDMEVTEAIQERLFCGNGVNKEDTHYYFSNTTAFESKLPHPLDPQNDEVINLRDIDTDLEMREFWLFYEKEIKHLKQVYGAANVHICWGYVQYYL